MKTKMTLVELLFFKLDLAWFSHFIQPLSLNSVDMFKSNKLIGFRNFYISTINPQLRLIIISDKDIMF